MTKELATINSLSTIHEGEAKKTYGFAYFRKLATEAGLKGEAKDAFVSEGMRAQSLQGTKNVVEAASLGFSLVKSDLAVRKNGDQYLTTVQLFKAPKALKPDSKAKLLAKMAKLQEQLDEIENPEIEA